MDATQILSSLKTRGLGGSLAYTLGRFFTVRRAYGIGVGLVQNGRGAAPIAGRGTSIFPPLDVDAALRSLRERAVFAQLALPAEAVDELTRFAREAPLRPPPKKYTFHYDEVRDGRVPNGDPAVVAIAVGAGEHPRVKSIAEDPQVYAITARYLGYSPSHIESRLMWSFVTGCSPEERRAATQTIDYHFDVHHYSFLYANYYLTDSDARSGAHVMIEGSHRRKPLAWMLGRAHREDAAVLGFYGAGSELVLAGPKGLGFIQDASCFHKALAPLDRPRLMLQVRYF